MLGRRQRSPEHITQATAMRHVPTNAKRWLVTAEF